MKGHPVLPDHSSQRSQFLLNSASRDGSAFARKKQNPADCGVLPFSAPDSGDRGGTEAVRTRLMNVSRASFGKVQSVSGDLKSCQ